MTTATKDSGLQSNMHVDYVINYRYATTNKTEAISQFEKLIQALASVGLETEVRAGEDLSLLVFVKATSQDHLYGEVYRSRVKDWTYGIRTEAPGKDIAHDVELQPLSEAERLRIVYQMISNPTEEGGAGITPKLGQWKYVDNIFALHDHQFNKKWVKELSNSYMLKPDQLDEIRKRFGERIGFYFAFIQSYFTFLIGLAVFGVSSYYTLGSFSPIYAIVNGLWCIVFTEWWKHQEVDLAIRWGVKGVSQLEGKRREFLSDKVIEDPVTGEKVGYFSATKRLQRQLLQIPFAIIAAALLGCLIAMCFGIEVFVSEVYDGPLKSVLIYLPTGILTTVMPILSGILHSTATRLNKFENYESQGAYKTALTQKFFVMDLVTSYLGIFLTAFVYVPFGKIVVPYLDVFSLTVRPFAENEKQMEMPDPFKINPDRLRKQVIYFTVTAQIINFLMELVVPYVQRRGLKKVKQMQSDYATKHGGAAPSVSENDPPEEASFLARVRKEAELSVYDVDVDIREMVIQFGYLALFSVVWPLTSVSFLINNWIELRADALKICVEMERPMPYRADTIGPWLDSLSFLSWMGSLTTGALVYMFSNDGIGPDGTPHHIKAWVLLLTIFFSEQIFLAARWGVRVTISKVQSQGRLQERRERYLVRKRYVEESFKLLPSIKNPIKSDTGVKIDKETLEEEARSASVQGSSVEDRFWLRQRGWQETAKIGSGIIDRTGPEESKKTQ